MYDYSLLVLRKFSSDAGNFLSSCFVIVKISSPYVNTGVARSCKCYFFLLMAVCPPEFLLQSLALTLIFLILCPFHLHMTQAAPIMKRIDLFNYLVVDTKFVPSMVLFTGS